MANSVTRQLLLAEIQKRGWRSETIGEQAFLKITHPDGRWNMLHGSCSKNSSAIGIWICKRKDLTLDFVRSYGYQVPDYALVENIEQAQLFLKQQGTIVVKPADGARTEGVSVGITDNQALAKSYHLARAASESQQVIVQKHLTGNLYRLLVLDGTLVAAAQRNAARVVGNGQHTITELVEKLNADPRRGKGTDSALKTIDIAVVGEYLGVSAMQTVPANGEFITLSAIDSISAGGEAVTVTETVHADWQRVCQQLAAEAGLFIAGYDVICDDITQPMDNNYFPLLEINSTPGFNLHEFPTGGGKPDHLAPLLLNALFPSID